MPRQATVQTQQNENESFERISWGTNFLMITFAFLVDTAQVGLDLIPFVGWILSSLLAGIGYLILLFIWKLNGVKFWERLGGKYGRKLLLRFGGSAFLEMILSFVPALTILVITTNSLLRSEDKLVQKGVITPDELNRIGELIVEHDVKSAKELLQLAREEAERRAQKRAREAARRVNHHQRQVGNAVRTYQNSIPPQNRSKYRRKTSTNK